jgi:hypothetical protein
MQTVVDCETCGRMFGIGFRNGQRVVGVEYTCPKCNAVRLADLGAYGYITCGACSETSYVDSTTPNPTYIEPPDGASAADKAKGDSLLAGLAPVLGFAAGFAAVIGIGLTARKR